MLTETLAKKVWLLLLPKPLPQKDKPILETLQSQPRTKPKPRNKANQNHCKPKRKLKTLKPISATRQNQPELMPAEKVPPKENAENLKTCLLKKILTKTADLKSATAKKVLNFYANHKSEPCESDMVLHLLFGSASQRLALLAGGTGR